MPVSTCDDPVVLNQWHPVSSLDEARGKGVLVTRLLDRRVSFILEPDGTAKAWLSPPRAAGQVEDARPADLVQTQTRYGFIWLCLGTPPERFFSFDELDEPDRVNVISGVFGVNVSAGRAVENFLDMGHFPYVHAGILGEQPHTEVKEYQVDISEEADEVLATQCQFYQPQAAVASKGGAMVDYIYRVPHPNCALLYKSSPNDATRMDVIYIFLQPMSEEQIRAHSGQCVIDNSSSPESIRFFQQTIFGQDRPILENQQPRRLPLDPRAETPIRADKAAIAYRRWLSAKGLRYGVIPAPESINAGGSDDVRT